MPAPPRTDHVLCLGPQRFHRMAYYDWGDIANPRVVVCVHGLTRNGRDFDTLAHALSSGFRVVCPDIVGRGRSDWLEAKAAYGLPQYLADVTALVARVTREGARSVDWIGTSMGALLGIVCAALPGQPIRRLIVNDAGPFIPRAALERIASYVLNEPDFANLDEAEAYLRRILAPFGRLSDGDWRHLTAHSVTERPDGRWHMRHDPGIAQVFEGALADVDLWPQWDAIRCETLVVRGARSDVLLPDTALDMTRRGPAARLVEIEGVGHAPMFMNDAQIRLVRDFLG